MPDESNNPQQSLDGVSNPDLNLQSQEQIDQLSVVHEASGPLNSVSNDDNEEVEDLTIGMLLVGEEGDAEAAMEGLNAALMAEVLIKMNRQLRSQAFEIQTLKRKNNNNRDSNGPRNGNYLHTRFLRRSTDNNKSVTQLQTSNSYRTSKASSKEREERKLPGDSYSFMIVTKPFTRPWNFGFSVWVFQMGMYTLIVNLFLAESNSRDILFNFPTLVSSFVSIAQVFALFVVNLMQDDIFIVFKIIALLGDKSIAHEVRQLIYGEEVDNLAMWKWIGIPCAIKFIQGLVGIIVTVVVVLQNSTIMGLFKDFTALIFIGQLDELVFSLSHIDHFGQVMQRAAWLVDSVYIPLQSNGRRNNARRDIPIYRLAQIGSIMLMLTSFVVVTIHQRSGHYIKLKYPHCHFDTDTFHEWFKLGNGVCQTEYNNPSCEFDGGDCQSYNLQFPNCGAKFPFEIGDGKCQSGINNTTECRFDGYDCFEEWFHGQCNDVNIELELLGNGNCNGGVYNSLECAFDAGDCLSFNEKYPSCKVKDPFIIGNNVCDNILTNEQKSNPLFIYSALLNPKLSISAACGLDGGDCITALFPDCNAPRLDYLGDGVCFNEEPYNTKACGYDGGDCLIFNRIYPNCNVQYPQWNGDGLCFSEYETVNTPECNFSGGDCTDYSRFPNCNASHPPLMSRGYCRPECGYSKTNSSCTNFEDKYPNCPAGNDFSKIGNGVCELSEFNVPACGYEDGDCVMVSSKSCQASKPSLLGNGYCDAGHGYYNSSECGWDGGDCVEANVNGLTLSYCTSGKETAIGNGFCNPENNNEACGWDGGDCDEFNKSYPNCEVDIPAWVGDGICHTKYNAIYNTTECGYDGGDCL